MNDLQERLDAVMEQLRQIEVDLRNSNEDAWINVTIDANDGTGHYYNDRIGLDQYNWDSSGC